MKLRTEISIPQSSLEINHKSSILTLGSCFSEEMGQRLVDNKFNVLNNAMGTTFNPVSIAQHLNGIISQKHTFLPCKLNDVFLDHHFHSSIFGYSSLEIEEKINTLYSSAFKFLSQPNPTLIITLGTAWLYKHKSSNTVVCNCHKQDPTLFNKELGTVELFNTTLSNSFDQLFSLYPNTNIILTLSPVRHTKEGLSENQVSKSILRVLCHQLSQTYKQVHYFPSYEIVLDDLRDYRFYESDLIHPNKQATNYIWDIFSNTFFNTSTLKLVKDWTKLKENISHKAFYEKSIEYKAFLENTLKQLQSIGKTLPVVEEIKTLEKRIQEFKTHE